MALRSYADMSLNEDDLYDRGMMPSEDGSAQYPNALQFYISKEDLEEAGGDGATPGQTMKFSAMGEVTSIFRGMDDTRIEIEICEFAGEDGKFFDLDQPAMICFCESEMRKMDLDDDAEMGDTIHLIGTARVETMSSTRYSDMICLQVTELTYVEDESEESREG